MEAMAKADLVGQQRYVPDNHQASKYPTEQNVEDLHLLEGSPCSMEIDTSSSLTIMSWAMLKQAAPNLRRHKEGRKLSEIILWSQDKVFLGYPENEFHLLITVQLLREKLKLKRTVNLLIVGACYDSLIASVLILIECTGCISTKVLYMACYKEDTDKWILKDFTLDTPAVGTIHMEVILSGVTSLVLWDDDTIFYTYKEHKQHGYLLDSETKSKFSAASKGSKIHQIVIDYVGNAIVKLENNALFFFKFETTDIVKLTPWEDNLTKFIFYFNPSGNMFLLTIDGRNIYIKVYPLKLEVFSVASKLKDVCPYISFENNLNLNVRYIDKGDKVAFWGQIVYLENYGLSVEVEIYRPELLQTKEIINYEIARGICTKNKEVIFDINKYGCPLQNHYTQNFYPQVEIFEGSKGFVPVEANYILWEMNGRIDFAYTATMEKSCFKKRSEQLRKLDGKYEILNSSGLNFLSWPQYTSTYMFKLTILDPNFSFCNLSTYFAVQTYGIIERPNWIHIAGWNILLLTLFWAFLIFSYFRYVKTFRAFPFVDPLKSLRPTATEEKA
ncbi:cation channel sperm-associated protein subunit epsilon [Thamnophis elegans]|uniref:cation channel sperm-associated protein subunit epsilon n=1 Tax=Thamnophis elegans TaxID=35005 RepID=UPI001376CA10|nr:cation channel sperm-associated protein subunit epsilon [Thamnophis elegans]